MHVWWANSNATCDYLVESSIHEEDELEFPISEAPDTLRTVLVQAGLNGCQQMAGILPLPPPLILTEQCPCPSTICTWPPQIYSVLCKPNILFSFSPSFILWTCLMYLELRVPYVIWIILCLLTVGIMRSQGTNCVLRSLDWRGQAGLLRVSSAPQLRHNSSHPSEGCLGVSQSSH